MSMCIIIIIVYRDKFLWYLLKFLFIFSEYLFKHKLIFCIIMSSRSEREKSKMQEKYQIILSQMLKEDDNRFCVDCDTKSKINK